MPSLDVARVPPEAKDTAVWAAALLHALAREEAAGRRPQRITEPRLGTWSRFRGRLTTNDLLALLFEDEAVLRSVPFDASAIGAPLQIDQLPESVTQEWVAAVQALDLKSAGAGYIEDQARLLGLSARLARSELHVVKRHQRVLELPGTGGQLAFRLVSTQRDLTLQDNFAVACGSWQELTLAGAIGLEAVAPHSDFALRIDVERLRDADHPLRQRSFDFVIGVHPDKGGLFRVENQLAIWFPTAKLVLV